MLVFNGFDHVVMVVRDAKAAAADWEKVLGGTALEPSAPSETRGEVEGVRFRVGDAWIELAQPMSAKSPLWGFLETQGQGVYSVGVRVGDVGAVVQRARRMGAGVLGGEIQPGRLFVEPSSTNGVLLGLHPEGAPAEGPLTFRRFHHIVVAVKDDDAAVANWERLFGTTPHPEGPDRVVHRHHIPVGDAWFGLTSAGTDADALAGFLKRRGEGPYLISVVVDDVRQAAGKIRLRGGRIIGDENGPGQVFVHPATTHGVLMELSDDTVRMWPG